VLNSFLNNKWFYRDVQSVGARQFLDALEGEDLRVKKLAIVGFLARVRVEESSGLVLIQEGTPGERRAVFDAVYKLFGGEEAFNKKITGDSWAMAIMEKKEELERELEKTRSKRAGLLWGGVGVVSGLVAGCWFLFTQGDSPGASVIEEAKTYALPDRKSATSLMTSVSVSQPPTGQQDLPQPGWAAKTSMEEETIVSKPSIPSVPPEVVSMPVQEAKTPVSISQEILVGGEGGTINGKPELSETSDAVHAVLVESVSSMGGDGAVQPTTEVLHVTEPSKVIQVGDPKGVVAGGEAQNGLQEEPLHFVTLEPLRVVGEAKQGEGVGVDPR